MPIRIRVSKTMYSSANFAYTYRPRGNQPSSLSTSYRDHYSRPSQSDTSSPTIQQRSPAEIQSGSTQFLGDVSDSPSIRSTGSLGHILQPTSPEAGSKDGIQVTSRSPKKRRLGSSSLSESTMTSKGKDLLPNTDFEPAIMTVEGATKTVDPVIVIQNYQKDPYSLDSELTLRYMDLYFTHVNQATYCMSEPASFPVVSSFR
jgi:hypothetical protein